MGLKVAVTGKGGVGKTTLAGTLACLLSRKGLRVLAVDADPNANLSYTLGLTIEEAEKIVPISENWSLIEEKTGVKPESYGSVFKLNFTIDDIISRFAVQTPCGVSLLVMGVVRDASQGCMCPANYLVRALLRHILVRRGEAVIVDMEAGTEHLGRGTAKHVDYMLIVVEPTMKSLRTALKIRDLATKLGIRNIFLVGNKIMEKADEEAIRDFSEENRIEILGLIPYDEHIRRADFTGKPPLTAFPSSPALLEMEAICNRLLK